MIFQKYACIFKRTYITFPILFSFASLNTLTKEHLYRPDGLWAAVQCHDFSDKLITINLYFRYCM